jgi:hypothetical protein
LERIIQQEAIVREEEDACQEKKPAAENEASRVPQKLLFEGEGEGGSVGKNRKAEIV